MVSEQDQEQTFNKPNSYKKIGKPPDQQNQNLNL